MLKRALDWLDERVGHRRLLHLALDEQAPPVPDAVGEGDRQRPASPVREGRGRRPRGDRRQRRQSCGEQQQAGVRRDARHGGGSDEPLGRALGPA